MSLEGWLLYELVGIGVIAACVPWIARATKAPDLLSLPRKAPVATLIAWAIIAPIWPAALGLAVWEAFNVRDGEEG